MPSFNLTIPDSSPLIQYRGPWVDTPKTDNDWQQYQNQTYHITNQDGATVSLRFNGSAIYIFGARKLGYADYSVSLDNDSSFQVSPPATNATEFNTLLYNATSLDITKEHEVILTNVWSPSGVLLDIDYLVITAGDGNIQTPKHTVFWKEDNTNITYSAGWELAPTNESYYDGEAQWTWTLGAFATVAFNGNAIAVYGTTNYDHGIYNMSIDGSTPTSFNGSAPEARFRTLLYFANGLPGGRHILSYTNISPAGADGRRSLHGIDLDTVQILSWPEVNPVAPTLHTPSQSSINISPGLRSSSTRTSPTKTPAKRPTTSSPRNAPAAIIAGSTICTAAGIALFIALFLYCRRKRHRSTVPGKLEYFSRYTSSYTHSQDGLFPISRGDAETEAAISFPTPITAASSSVLLIEHRSTTSNFSVSPPAAQTATPPPPPSISASVNNRVREKLKAMFSHRRRTQTVSFASRGTAPPPYV